MKRLAVVISLVLFVVAGATVHAKLTSGDKSKIRKWLANYLFVDYQGERKEEKLAAYDELSTFFADKRKRADLSEVEDLHELLAHSMVRDTDRKGVILEEEWTLKKDFNVDALGRFKYSVWVPKKYSGSARSDAWPLIICLPEKGQDPTEYIEKNWANDEIREKYLIAALGFDYGDIRVTKNRTVKEDDKVRIEKYDEQVPFSWTGDGYEWPLNRFYRTMVLLQLRDYKVDPNRIILNGTGLGASGAVAYASDSAWRFAGLIVRGGEDDRPTLQNLAHLPVLAYADDAATEASKKTHEMLKSVVGDGYVEGAGTEWFATDADAGGEELLKWLDKCVRDRYAMPSKWVRVDGRQQIGYWCAINGVHVADQPAELSLDVDKRKNKLLVTATNVAEFDIYLNDEILNLEKPIELIINEEKVDTFTVERSGDLFLSHLLKTPPLDPGAVFPAEILGIKIEAPKVEEEDGGEEKPEEGDDSDGGN